MQSIMQTGIARKKISCYMCHAACRWCIAKKAQNVC